MTNPTRILIIDDERQIVQGMQTRLRGAGYETVAAHDAEIGLELATSSHPDVIILDVRMPGMDGLAALTTLKCETTTKDIPVIMLSASQVDRYHALELGTSFFIEKPYEAQTLLSAIESAIGATAGSGNP